MAGTRRILYRLRAFVGAVPRAAVRRQAARFLRATVDCRCTQQRVLERLLVLNAESRFSRERRLQEVRNLDELRRRLPVADYEVFRPYIQRLKVGDHSALLGSRNRLLMFSLSSGTTDESKFIPITRPFLDDYRAGWQIWGIHVLDDHPEINSRKIVQFSSSYDRFRTPGGTPCGNISGLVAAMQKPIVRTMYTVPGTVAEIADPAAKNYTAMRLAVADPHVALITTANPATLTHLAKLADLERESLIRDIADGTLSSAFDVPAGIRRKLRRRIRRRDPLRARQLERIVEEKGALYPLDYWPDLALVAVWTGGSAGSYLRALGRFYGDVPIRDHGLSASEGRMTIPLCDSDSAGVLDVTTHVFEFIPEEEHDSKNPVVLEPHELEPGRNYFILLTTSSGLYRYDICDVVRCVGFCHTTPLLEFLHKGAHIASVTGEKVSESQVVAAMRSCLERLRIPLGDFTVSPIWGEPPRYQLLAEEWYDWPAAAGSNLARMLDDRLQALNCEYRNKRQTGRLGELAWVPLPRGTWQKFSCKRQERLGGSLEQYKHPCLVPDMNFSTELLWKFVADVREPDASGSGRATGVSRLPRGTVPHRQSTPR